MSGKGKLWDWIVSVTQVVWEGMMAGAEEPPEIIVLRTETGAMGRVGQGSTRAGASPELWHECNGMRSCGSK